MTPLALTFLMMSRNAPRVLDQESKLRFLSRKSFVRIFDLDNNLVIMKKTLIAAVLFGTSLTSIAQSDSSFVEVGMNVVPVFRSLQKENSDIPYSPYALTIEKKFKSLGLRLGAGYHSDSFNELAGQSNGNTDFVIDTTALDLRLGLVFYKNFKNNFSIKYGVDGVISNSSKSYNTVFIDEIGETREIVN